MIVNPCRRLWLYPAPDGSLEILIFGSDEDVAALYPTIRTMAEQWRGFDRVSALAQVGTVLGVRVTIAPLARYREPVREGVHAIATTLPMIHATISWAYPADPDSPTGMIGTW